MAFTATDVASLGRKLDELDLSDGEAAVLAALFDAAAEAASAVGWDGVGVDATSSSGSASSDGLAPSTDVPAADEVMAFASPDLRPSFAARLGSIGFFDEADALFGKVRGARGYIGETEKNVGG